MPPSTGPVTRTGAEPISTPLRRTVAFWSAMLTMTDTGPEAARSGCHSYGARARVVVAGEIGPARSGVADWPGCTGKLVMITVIPILVAPNSRLENCSGRRTQP